MADSPPTDPTGSSRKGRSRALPFEFIDPDPFDPDPLRAEQAMLARASVGAPLAQLCQMPVSLVVPRSYQRFSALENARAEFARRGCPVFLRMSGGGLVPQGPGILNLSLAYRVRIGQATLPALSGTIYAHLCGVLQHALRGLGVRTHYQAVDGAFCDGRFNLVCRFAGGARKIAGSAQYWRRIPGATHEDALRHVVLAHAVLLVSADPVAIHARANAFETALGNDRRYDAATALSVRQALDCKMNADGGAPDRPAFDSDPADPELDARVRAALRAAVLRRPPPCQDY